MRRLLLVLGVCSAAVLARAAPAPKEGGKLVVVSGRTGNKNLTDSKATNSYPAWSPDGKQIAFASDRDGVMNIYVMDADGKNVKALTKGQELSRVPTWSPDGKKIAFCRMTQNGTQIHVMDADGKNVKQVGDGDGWDPCWSPDGKK